MDMRDEYLIEGIIMLNYMYMIIHMGVYVCALDWEIIERSKVAIELMEFR